MKTDETTPAISVPIVIAILFLLGFATGISALAGVIVAQIKRDDVRGTWAESHVEYLIRTFWFGLFALIVGFMMTVIGIGWLVILAWVLWTLVRTIRSLVMALDREPIPEPSTLLW